LICKERNFGACGLQDFDAGEVGRIRPRRERNRAWNGRPCRVVKSAGYRRNPREHAGPRNKKGQPRVVDLSEFVMGRQRTTNSVYQRVRRGADCWGFTRKLNQDTTVHPDDQVVARFIGQHFMGKNPSVILQSDFDLISAWERTDVRNHGSSRSTVSKLTNSATAVYGSGSS
jgi:hypothetical protein